MKRELFSVSQNEDYPACLKHLLHRRMLGAASCLFAEIPSSCDRKKEKKATSGENRKIMCICLRRTERFLHINGVLMVDKHKKLRANFVDVAFKRHGD